MINKIKVEVVKTAPKQFTDMLAGIRTKEEAKNWGEKWGFTVVYFLPTRERVYAQRMRKVSDQAKTLETKSVRLTAIAQAAIERTR